MNAHGKHELQQLQSLPLEYKIELTKQRIAVWYNSWTKFEIFNEATGKTRFTTIDTRDFLAQPKMKPSEYIVSEESGQVYVSFSGGKDSTVLKHIVDSMYDNVPAVFVNTGLEYPEIQKFVRDIKAGKYDCFNSDVEILRPEMRFDEVLKKTVIQCFLKTYLIAFFTTGKDGHGRSIYLTVFTVKLAFKTIMRKVGSRGGNMLQMHRLKFLRNVAMS